MPAVGTEGTWQYVSHVITLPNPMSAQCSVEKVKRSITCDLCSQKPYSLAPELSQINTNGEIYLTFLLIKVKINHNSFNRIELSGTKGHKNNMHGKQSMPDNLLDVKFNCGQGQLRLHVWPLL